MREVQRPVRMPRRSRPRLQSCLTMPTSAHRPQVSAAPSHALSEKAKPQACAEGLAVKSAGVAEMCACWQNAKNTKICPFVLGEDGETESSSDEEGISEAESDADEARGAPSVIADTLGSQEEALTQARPRAMPHTEGSL